MGKYGKPYEGKTIAADFARQLNSGALKVVSVYVGAFLEILFRYPVRQQENSFFASFTNARLASDGSWNRPSQPRFYGYR